ncbi:related to defective in cullin neddylation protein 1 [Ramularia collo-cygni]|uniref:Defective in cullin neddylation protein n=1 Tax=Ramularia collo-cygni TaxID=112498 RepID=A0A2D3UQG0_9PEZI|nr:related to defective in cullin neddylation protein 1 [Ramularia collo-cygni]CZT19112.1 related to defective in cullin neddylation protein 1 [Ramularia collo-cygni]
MPKRKVVEEAPTAAVPATPKKRARKTGVKGKKHEAYTSQQTKAISDFVSVTQANTTTAAKILKQHNWNVGAAANAYFNNPTGGSNPLRTSLSKTFDKYRDDPKNTPDEIGVEGTGTLLQELDIEVADVAALVFSELVQSPSLGTITRDGFVDGFSDVGVDSLPKMRNIVLQRRSQLPTDKEVFKRVYNHTFVLALQEKQKGLSMEMAMEFWKVLFEKPAFEWRTASTPWLDWWFEFYESKVKKAVNKDLWKQILNFAQETMKDDTLSFWTEESSWPSVIDEFVEWVKTEKRPGGDAMEIS